MNPLRPLCSRLCALDTENLRDMDRLVAACLLLHLLIWTLLPGISHRAPPWDNIEQLVWTQSLQWGYYKHPPAPTWWMSAWTQLLGRSVWVTFFAAQLSVVGMLWCMWRVLRACLPPARALVAVLLTSMVAYHGLRGIMANHNTLQLLPVGLLVWTVFAAVRAPSERARWLWWAGAGAAAALAFLSKYSALVWFAAIALWVMSDARMRSARAWAPVLLAALLALALVSPHLLWLARSDFAALRYAQASVEAGNAAAPSHWIDLWHFSGAQLARMAPAIAALLLLRWRLRGSDSYPTSGGASGGASGGVFGGTAGVQEGRLIIILGMAPLAITLALGIGGLHLASSWATTFYLFFGALLLPWVPQVAPRRLVLTTVALVLAAQVVLAGGLALGRGVLVDVLGRNARSNFPAPALALALNDLWAQQARTPLRIVAGETWLAGNVSLHLPSHPLVFINADPAQAPWIDLQKTAGCDTLVLIDRSSDAPIPSAQVLALMQAAQNQGRAGQVDVAWTSRPDGPRLRVDWGIVAAPEAGGCGRGN